MVVVGEWLGDQCLSCAEFGSDGGMTESRKLHGVRETLLEEPPVREAGELIGQTQQPDLVQLVAQPLGIRFDDLEIIAGLFQLGVKRALALDQFFAFGAIVEDIAERPYITVGFTAFVLLIPLALTSTNAMVRRLGGKRWRRLHQLVYVSAAGGVLHFIWQTKADYRRPAIYATALILLPGGTRAARIE